MGDIPLMSVIMPAFNAEKTIAESISSVVMQTYLNWELIVVDDFSTDNTAQIIEKFSLKDNRIRTVFNESNKGVADSRNQAISLANGEYVAFLDSDDLWHRDKLKMQLKFMQNHNASISYTATAYIYEESHSSYILHAKHELTYKDLLKRNLMSCSSVMVRRELIQSRLFTKGNHHEDLAVWLQILRKEKIAYGLNQPLLIYRRTVNTKSGRLISSGMMTYHTFRIEGYSIIASAFLTFRFAFHAILKRFLVKRGVTKNDRQSLEKAGVEN